MKGSRFIAGAVCPSCRAMDRLVLELTGEDRKRRCVACGYQDSLDASGSLEPKTRLAGGLSRDVGAADEGATKVRILEPAPKRPEKGSNN